MEIQQYTENKGDARSEVLTSVTMNIQVFWEYGGSRLRRNVRTYCQPVRREVPAELNLRKKEYQ
jgi:hypothetical protein